MLSGIVSSSVFFFLSLSVSVSIPAHVLTIAVCVFADIKATSPTTKNLTFPNSHSGAWVMLSGIKGEK